MTSGCSARRSGAAAEPERRASRRRELSEYLRYLVVLS